MEEYLSAPSLPSWTEMAFSERLVALRKEQNLTQQVLAARIGLHVTLLRRYESGKTQPSMDALRRIALALNVSADVLLFEAGERGPSDDLLHLFEAANRLNNDERRVLRELVEGLLMKHEVKRLAAAG